jgi:hypothetical protein
MGCYTPTMISLLAQLIVRTILVLGVAALMWSSTGRAAADCDEMSYDDAAPTPIIVPCAALEGGLLVHGCPNAALYGQTVHGVVLCALTELPLWVHSEAQPTVEASTAIVSPSSSLAAFAVAPALLAWPDVGRPFPASTSERAIGQDPHGADGHGREDPEPS